MFQQTQIRYFIYINQSKMRKDQVELIKNINNSQKMQFYLFEIPKTPQQKFLHLFAHKNLIKKDTFHYNLGKIINLLQGSFICNTLRLSFIVRRIQKKIQVNEDSPLLQLIAGWVNYFPTIKTNEKCIIQQIILQDSLEYENIKSFELFLTYLNIISPDIWKILLNTRNVKQFQAVKPFKDLIKQTYELDLKRFEIDDLLFILNGCLPKNIFNIILDQQNIPHELRSKHKKFQCLFSNQNVQYLLKNCHKLALVIRQIFLILIVTSIGRSEQKNLALVTMRYFFVYHYDKKYFAAQIFIYVFNKLDQDVKKDLIDNFYLFFKILKKLGKNKFLTFLENNSPFLKNVIEFINKNPVVGYSLNSINPYNYFNIAQKVQILRGSSQTRIFEVLQQLSAIYLKIKVKSLDIIVRLSYLGQIGSQKQEKIALLTIQKTQQHSTSIMAFKRGLYMLQFDNTFSWINNKQVSYDIVVCCPLEMRSLHYDKWISQYYDGCHFNELANQKDIVLVQNKKADNKKDIVGKANLSRQRQLYNLNLHYKDKEQYVYETDNPERMKQKVKSILSSKDSQYAWTIKNKEIKHEDQLIKFIEVQQQTEYQLSSQHKIVQKSIMRQQPRQKKKEILAKYESDDDEDNKQKLQKQKSPQRQQQRKTQVKPSDSKLNQSSQDQSTLNLHKNTKVVAKQLINQSYQQADNF